MEEYEGVGAGLARGTGGVKLLAPADPETRGTLVVVVEATAFLCVWSDDP